MTISTISSYIGFATCAYASELTFDEKGVGCSLCVPLTEFGTGSCELVPFDWVPD